jgi:hypothetical protein
MYTPEGMTWLTTRGPLGVERTKLVPKGHYKERVRPTKSEDTVTLKDYGYSKGRRYKRIRDKYFSKLGSIKKGKELKLQQKEGFVTGFYGNYPKDYNQGRRQRV